MKYVATLIINWFRKIIMNRGVCYFSKTVVIYFTLLKEKGFKF